MPLFSSNIFILFKLLLLNKLILLLLSLELLLFISTLFASDSELLMSLLIFDKSPYFFFEKQL